MKEVMKQSQAEWDTTGGGLTKREGRHVLLPTSVPRDAIAPASRSAKPWLCLKYCAAYSREFQLLVRRVTVAIMQYPSRSSENVRITWLQCAEHYGAVQPATRSQNVTIIINNRHGWNWKNRIQQVECQQEIQSIYHWLRSCTISLAGKLIVRTKIIPSGELFWTVNFQVGWGFYLDFLDSEVLVHLGHRLYRLRQCLPDTQQLHIVQQSSCLSDTLQVW